jgi:methionyl aminopeptidase
MEARARGCGFSVIRDLPGHGVGRTLHEPPSVPGYFHPRFSARLRRGMVLTVEPFLSTGASQVIPARDGWTLVTPDRSPVVQYEHTIVVTRGRPIVLTASGQ